MVKPLPPATVAALSPPPGDAFPYTFFRDVAHHAFDPKRTAFDPRNAWWLCDPAFLAYSGQAQIAAEYAKPPLSARVQPFAARHGTACYVAAGDQWIVLVFRGTSRTSRG